MLDPGIIQGVLSERMAASAGADPGMAVDQLRQSIATISGLFPQVALKNPEVGKYISQAYKSLQMALEAAEEAQSVQQNAQQIQNTVAEIAGPGGPMMG